MKNLWRKTWELFRRHWIILWLPYLCAGLVGLGNKQLTSAAVKAIVKRLATRHSVLGGSYTSPDLYSVQRQALIAAVPIGFITQFLTVCCYVVAFSVTARMVEETLKERMPEVTKALAETAPRWRDILLFSLKFCVAFGVLTGTAFLALNPNLNSMPHSKSSLSQVLIPMVALLVIGCVAWLLIPAAFRLVRDSAASAVSAAERKLGTAVAVLGSVASLGLSEAALRAESGFTIGSKAEWTALSALNNALINLPQALAFIALALLALQSAGNLADPDASTLPVDSPGE